MRWEFPFGFRIWVGEDRDEKREMESLAALEGRYWNTSGFKACICIYSHMQVHLYIDCVCKREREREREREMLCNYERTKK